MTEQPPKCCDRPNLRTLYRGSLGCAEECERCGQLFLWNKEEKLIGMGIPKESQK
jgi:hypothetical protein